MVYWELVYQIIEFASTLLFFKLFIYEEIAQAGAMYCFIINNNLGGGDTTKIKQLTQIHAIIPAKECLTEYWVLAPWVVDGFNIFFKAAEQSLEAFD